MDNSFQKQNLLIRPLTSVSTRRTSNDPETMLDISRNMLEQHQCRTRPFLASLLAVLTNIAWRLIQLGGLILLPDTGVWIHTYRNGGLTFNISDSLPFLSKGTR